MSAPDNAGVVMPSISVASEEESDDMAVNWKAHQWWKEQQNGNGGDPFVLTQHPPLELFTDPLFEIGVFNGVSRVFGTFVELVGGVIDSFYWDPLVSFISSSSPQELTICVFWDVFGYSGSWPDFAHEI